MSSAFEKYKELMSDLILRRTTTKLSMQDEAWFVGKLDSYWHEMSDAEQIEVERMYAAGA